MASLYRLLCVAAERSKASENPFFAPFEALTD